MTTDLFQSRVKARVRSPTYRFCINMFSPPELCLARSSNCALSNSIKESIVLKVPKSMNSLAKGPLFFLSLRLAYHPRLCAIIYLSACPAPSFERGEVYSPEPRLRSSNMHASDPWSYPDEPSRTGPLRPANPSHLNKSARSLLDHCTGE